MLKDAKKEGRKTELVYDNFTSTAEDTDQEAKNNSKTGLP